MPTTALQFSGGKDSLACLYLLQPHWDEILVIWMNAGAPFPETVKMMADVKAMVPHFLEVTSDVLNDIARHGLPSDIVPVESTAYGKTGCGKNGPLIREWTDCCANNIWAPMAEAMERLGITKVIRGQRKADIRKSPLPSGTVVNGIEYVFPINDWSDEQVFTYLQSRGVAIPECYAYMNDGLDCWCCTAHLPYFHGLGRYLKDKHPALHAIRKDRIATLYSAIDQEHARVKRYVELEIQT